MSRVKAGHVAKIGRIISNLGRAKVERLGSAAESHDTQRSANNGDATSIFHRDGASLEGGPAAATVSITNWANWAIPPLVL